MPNDRGGGHRRHRASSPRPARYGRSSTPCAAGCAAGREGTARLQRAALAARKPRPQRQAIQFANAQQAGQQTIKQLRPIFQSELQLLTLAAEPTPSQRREIAIEAGRTLKLNLWRVAANNGIAQPGQVVVTNDPRNLVRQHLELAAWSKLSNVQSARYRDELDRKAQDRREVVLLNIVANPRQTPSTRLRPAARSSRNAPIALGRP